ncbi:hypothetical protein QWJ07_27310 [Frankia sp. RB7]|nr:hypothetical protein [Frankia sp. RB7]
MRSLIEAWARNPAFIHVLAWLWPTFSELSLLHQAENLYAEAGSFRPRISSISEKASRKLGPSSRDNR